MHKLMDYVCKELETLEQKIMKNGGLSSTDLQNLDTLTKVKKNLKKLEKMGDDEDTESYRRSYRNSYAGTLRPVSEVDRYSDRRDRMGRYSRRDDYSGADDYSRAGTSELVEELRAMMGTLPANKQQELDQLLQRYEG